VRRRFSAAVPARLGIRMDRADSSPEVARFEGAHPRLLLRVDRRETRDLRLGPLCTRGQIRRRGVDVRRQRAGAIHGSCVCALEAAIRPLHFLELELPRRRSHCRLVLLALVGHLLRV
jgi:hypothetical protein